MKRERSELKEKCAAERTDLLSGYVDWQLKQSSGAPNQNIKEGELSGYVVTSVTSSCISFQFPFMKYTGLMQYVEYVPLGSVKGLLDKRKAELSEYLFVRSE